MYGIVFVRTNTIEDTEGLRILGLSGSIGKARLRAQVKKAIGTIPGAIDLDGTYAIPEASKGRLSELQSEAEAAVPGALSIRFLPLSESGLMEIENEATVSIEDLLNKEKAKLEEGKNLSRAALIAIYNRISDLTEVGIGQFEDQMEEVEELMTLTFKEKGGGVIGNLKTALSAARASGGAEIEHAGFLASFDGNRYAVTSPDGDRWIAPTMHKILSMAREDAA